MRKFLVFLLSLLCFCNIALADEPKTGEASGSNASSSDSKDEEKKEDIIILKVKDPKTGKEVEVEVKDGQMPDGKIFIGVGRKKGNLEKERKIKATKVPNVKAPAGKEDPNVKDKDKFSNESVPGLQLVENMRALKKEIPFRVGNESYVDPVSGYQFGGSETACVYSISRAAEGTPYGSLNIDGTGGPIMDTFGLIGRARELDQLVEISADDSNFEEAKANVMPGDVIIVNNWTDSNGVTYRGVGHAVMAKLNDDGTIGSIQNGSSGKEFPGGSIWESNSPPWTMGNPWGYLIKSSGYSGGMLMGNLFDGLQQLGEALNKIIERFSGMAIEAHEKISPIAFELIACLCIIDLVLSIIIAGFEINPNTLFVKVLKYGFIYWIYAMWPTIVDTFFQSVVISLNETVNPEDYEVAVENICQPQFVLQKVMYLIKPGFDYIGSMNKFSFTLSFFTGGAAYLLLGAIATLIVMLIYIVFAVYVSYVYISFFVYAALSVVSVPFMASKFTKFFPEGAVGGAWNAMIRMMVLTFMLGMMMYLFTGADFAQAGGMAKDVNTASTFNLVKGNLEMFVWYLKQCTVLSIFVFFVIKVTNSIVSKLGGRFEIAL